MMNELHLHTGSKSTSSNTLKYFNLVDCFAIYWKHLKEAEISEHKFFRAKPYARN